MIFRIILPLKYLSISKNQLNWNNRKNLCYYNFYNFVNLIYLGKMFTNMIKQTRDSKIFIIIIKK